ncbi:hypothetical protein F5B17DRAFT_436285 [Nemania serpens]|nr:hypothetical protein F5B17DRAFT_436285 [Nemania serpens]
MSLRRPSDDHDPDLQIHAADLTLWRPYRLPPRSSSSTSKRASKTRHSRASSTPDLEANVTCLLAAFRASENTHVIHVHHHSRSEAPPLHPSRPGEVLRSKDVNSAFIGTDVESVIQDLGILRLVLASLTTCHCISISPGWRRTCASSTTRPASPASGPHSVKWQYIYPRLQLEQD